MTKFPGQRNYLFICVLRIDEYYENKTHKNSEFDEILYELKTILEINTNKNLDKYQRIIIYERVFRKKLINLSQI